MQSFRLWAFWRRMQYGAGYLSFTAAIICSVYYVYFYNAPTCFDNAQNGDEIGVDCGGSCKRICAFTVKPPSVLWANSFEIQPGQYNAVAYIDNTNVLAGTPSINYTFTLYDDAGEVITERTGATVLPPESTYPVFEGRIITGDRVPVRTVLTLTPSDLWLPSNLGRAQFRTVDLKLVEADARPKLNVKIENTALQEAQQVEVVATIFDARGTPLTASQTFIDIFPGRTQQDIVFTWPNPIAKTVRSCDVPTDTIMAIDLSGSMNNDGGNPPQPISNVLSAASTFVSQLRDEDRVGVVTFATKAATPALLTKNFSTTASTITQLTIDPKEESGGTNTGDGLLAAQTELNSSRHNLDARRIVVLLTDGLATEPGTNPEAYAREQAEKLKADGITIYTIGLGNGVNMDFLRSIATTPTQAYVAPTTATLGSIYKAISGSICEDGAARIDVIGKTRSTFDPLR